jgi:8-oxo-dGTP pyrophosphatase MutT (NUDIX family)
VTGRRRLSLARIEGPVGDAAGQRVPVTPRDAATVVLLRPGAPAASADAADAGVEVLLLARARAMDFAPGAHVFPGGSVDPLDAEDTIAWTGPSPSDLSAVLAVPPDRCRSLVVAAVRETFEESGVLLAGDPLPADTTALTADRHALLGGTASLAEVLHRHGLALRADLLTPWARWITPEVSRRRYDTWFFVAAMPPGQAADAGVSAAGASAAAADSPGAEAVAGTGAVAGYGPESESAAWLRPGDALEAARAGQLTLLPPTAVTLAELAANENLAGILGRRRPITPRMPTVTVEDGRVWLTMPDDVEYPL